MSSHTTQPVEHIAARPSSASAHPPLRKPMSRVLSRVMSITRKDQSQQPPSQAVLKPGSERAVHIERGYEVIPRVTSTHLKRSESGLKEVSLNVPLNDQAHNPSQRPKEYPFYSHPQLPSHLHAAGAGTQPAPRRQSITTKLSRNQIANFRRASASSRTLGGASSASTTYKREGKARVQAPGPCTEGELSLRTAPDSHRRRHLASSRSTAEMRGRSSGESTRPSTVSSIDELASTPTANRRADHQTPADPLAGVRTPVADVWPERLIQRGRTYTPSPDLKVLRPGSPAFPRPLPAVPRSSGSSHRKPVPPTFDASPCSTDITTPSPVTPKRTSVRDVRVPNDPESLEQLFDEVMSACRVEVKSMADVPQEDKHASLFEPSELDSLTPTKPIATQSTGMKRFIPSGRSFEPLKSTLTHQRVVSKSMDGAKSVGKATRHLVIGGKVKEAIAKLERNISDSPQSKPSTPVRVLGDILNRPTSVSSAGLSAESRKMMWEARQLRGLR